MTQQYVTQMTLMRMVSVSRQIEPSWTGLVLPCGDRKRVELDSHFHVGQLIIYGDTANQYRVMDVIVTRDIVLNETLPASQPAVLTSEPAVLDEIRVLPIPTFSASLKSSDDSAAVKTTTAIAGDDSDEPTEEENIPTGSRTSRNSILEEPRKRSAGDEMR